MSASVNKMILVGNLGGDPELKTTPGGSQVCEFSIACNETWKDKDGNQQEHTEWTRIVVWGKQAEPCGKYLKKGRQVYVEGRKRTRKWEDKDNNKRETVECVAIDVKFLGSKDENAGDSSRSDDGAF